MNGTGESLPQNSTLTFPTSALVFLLPHVVTPGKVLPVKVVRTAYLRSIIYTSGAQPIGPVGQVSSIGPSVGQIRLWCPALPPPTPALWNWVLALLPCIPCTLGLGPRDLPPFSLALCLTELGPEGPAPTHPAL